jgi:hypothetical protein
VTSLNALARAPAARTRSPVEITAAAALLALAAVPFWAGRYLPFLDLPQHLALSRIIAAYHDPATRFADYYAIDWRITPYWGFYAAMLVLQQVTPAELAARMLFTAYAVGLPLGAAYCLASFGRDWRWAVLTLPLVYNTNLFLGFATFNLSLPLFLFALGASARHVASNRFDLHQSISVAALAGLVYLFHVQSYALLGLCVVTLGAIHWRGLRWAVARASPYSLSLLLFAPWFRRSFVTPEPQPPSDCDVVGHYHQGYGRFGDLDPRFEPLPRLVATIPERLVGAFNDGSDYRIGAALLVVFLAALALRSPRRSNVTRTLREAVLEWRGHVVCLVLFCGYLFAPIEIKGQWYINPRHLVFAALTAPLLLGAPASGRGRVVLWAGAALAVAASANAARQISRFQYEVGPFDAVISRTEPGRRMMGLIFEDGDGGAIRWWPFVHWACYYQVRRGGDVSFSFAGLPSIPVVYRHGMRGPHPDEWSPEDFDWNTMAPAYDWFLVRGRPVGGATALLARADLVAAAGPWTLYRQRMPRVTSSGLCSPPR